MISKDTARKAITRVAGLELKNSDVQIKALSGTGTTAEVVAAIKTAFQLQQNDQGQWQAVEVRVGDRQWEEIDLLTRAWHTDRTTPLLTQLEALTAQLVARAAEQQRRKEKNEPADKEPRKATDKDQRELKEPRLLGANADDTEDLRAGPLVVKNFSALLSSATIEAELDATFRLNRERGQWQVTAARIGDGAWQEIAPLVAALNTEKATRARADLATLAAALEAFRRERGFYVVADTSAALVDQLNPRYTTSIIRLDPWHRPYEYTATPATYTLRSLGPDGKANTADDVTSGNAGP